MLWWRNSREIIDGRRKRPPRCDRQVTAGGMTQKERDLLRTDRLPDPGPGEPPERPDEHPHCCLGGWVLIGHEAPGEDGDPVEMVAVYRCRRGEAKRQANATAKPGRE